MKKPGWFHKPDRRAQFRIYMILLPILSLAAAISVNAVAGFLSESFDLRLDMTQSRMYELSRQTTEILESLQEDIEIYTLFRTGGESKSVTNLLDKMESRSDRLHVSNIDPVRTPVFTEQFDPNGMGIAENSIIVSDAARVRYRVISPGEFYTVDSNTGKVTGFVAEQKIISAVEYARTGKQDRILLIQGHGEPAAKDLESPVWMLESTNYIIQERNIALSNQPLDPEIDLVLIIEPIADITQEEYESLSVFLKGGGRLMLCVGPQASRLENMNQLLSRFNFVLGSGTVVEGNQSNYVNEKTNLVPFMSDTDITSVLAENQMAAVMPNTRPITPVSDKISENIAVSVLLGTTGESYVKEASDTLDKTPNDAAGPFAVGIAAVEKLGEEKFCYVIVYGSSQWLLDGQAFQNPGNYNLLLTSVSWLYSGKKSVNVAPKPLGGDVLAINSNALKLAISIVVLAIIPLLVLFSGFYVTIRRRRG